MSLWFPAAGRPPATSTGDFHLRAACRTRQKIWSPPLRARASARRASIFSAASVAALVLGRQGVAGRRRDRLAWRVRRRALPVDYYGLLGLDKFEADQNDIKAAHRRMVKLVHPDILGGESAELLRMVTEAYSTLSDDAARAEYDAMLGCGTGKTSFFKSKWHPEAPANGKAAFVDQSQCVICFNCTDMAPDTFEMDADRGRARVFMQQGDWEEDIDAAVESCPTQCISYVEPTDLPFLEEAMDACELLDPHILARKRSGNMVGPPMESPWTSYQALKAKGAQKTGAGAVNIGRGSAQGHDQIAEAISRAASVLPEETCQKTWGA